MKTRNQVLEEVFQKIMRQEEIMEQLLTSQEAWNILSNTCGKKFDRLHNLRVKLFHKRTAYINCEKLVVDMM